MKKLQIHDCIHGCVGNCTDSVCDEHYPMLKVSRIHQEASNIRTLFFNQTLHSKPGQFVMAWLPGYPERPFSIASDNGKEISISVAGVGVSSTEMAKLNVGHKLGIRGPYGTHFTLSKQKNIIGIGGGYGLGPVVSFAEQAISKGLNTTVIAGARTKELIIFKQRLEGIKKKANVIITTNDGSEGIKGLVTEPLKEILKRKAIEEKESSSKLKTDFRVNLIDLIFACGPEMMLYSIFLLAEQNKVECQLSIERYMKCGIGICGSCSIDPEGWRACVEGPIFTSEIVRKMIEFGKYHRDAAGVKIPFQ